LEGFKDEALAVSELELAVIGDLDVAVFLQLKIQLIRRRDFHLVTHGNNFPLPEI
jgi:hypothetical protein